jgi:hypothetical protein
MTDATHLLEILDDIDSISFYATPATLRALSYRIRAPETTLKFRGHDSEDGGELLSATRRNVAEVWEARIKSASAADCEPIVQRLQRFFLRAEAWATKRKGGPVSARMKLRNSTSGVYKTELFSGTVEHAEGLLGWQWDNGILVVIISWTRRYYWEAEAETAIPLTNGNGSSVISGLTVRNHNDGGAGDDNWVEISANAITGVLPVPIRLELTNTYASVTNLGTVIVGHGVYSGDPAYHVLEAENGTGGVTSADAGSSNGAYQTLSWSGSAETTIWTTTLSTALLNAYRGQYVRLFARYAGTPVEANWIRLRLKLEGTTIYETEEIQLETTDELQEWWTLQLPPYEVASGDTIYPLTLTLSGRAKSGGLTLFFPLDCIYLMPLDGLRTFTPRAFGLPYTARIIDDGATGLTTTDGYSTAGRTGHYEADGQILLEPGRLQRLYVVQTSMTNFAPAARTLSVKAWYRPRRLTV